MAGTTRHELFNGQGPWLQPSWQSRGWRFQQAQRSLDFNLHLVVSMWRCTRKYSNKYNRNQLCDKFVSISIFSVPWASKVVDRCEWYHRALRALRVALINVFPLACRCQWRQQYRSIYGMLRVMMLWLGLKQGESPGGVWSRWWKVHRIYALSFNRRSPQRNRCSRLLQRALPSRPSLHQLEIIFVLGPTLHQLSQQQNHSRNLTDAALK